VLGVWLLARQGLLAAPREFASSGAFEWTLADVRGSARLDAVVVLPPTNFAVAVATSPTATSTTTAPSARNLVAASSPPSHTSSSLGLALGIAGGLLACFSLLIIVFILLKRRKKKPASSSSRSASAAAAASSSSMHVNHTEMSSARVGTCKLNESGWVSNLSIPNNKYSKTIFLSLLSPFSLPQLHLYV
jgi:hypothetical protein